MNRYKRLVEMKSKIILGKATSLEKYMYWLEKNKLIKKDKYEQDETDCKQDNLCK